MYQVQGIVLKLWSTKFWSTRNQAPSDNRKLPRELNFRIHVKTSRKINNFTTESFNYAPDCRVLESSIATITYLLPPTHSQLARTRASLHRKTQHTHTAQRQRQRDSVPMLVFLFISRNPTGSKAGKSQASGFHRHLTKSPAPGLPPATQFHPLNISLQEPSYRADPKLGS